jgi:hypothetical protein
MFAFSLAVDHVRQDVLELFTRHILSPRYRKTTRLLTA